MTTHPDSFKSQATLTLGETTYEYFRLDALKGLADLASIPYSIRILLENLLRYEDGKSVTRAMIEGLAKYDATNVGESEIEPIAPVALPLVATPDPSAVVHDPAPV